MSDAATDYTSRPTLAETVARIEWAQAGTHEFVAEHDKLAAEALELWRDRLVSPALALAATLGAIATPAPAILRAIGGHG